LDLEQTTISRGHPGGEIVQGDWKEKLEEKLAGKDLKGLRGVGGDTRRE